jgi:phosphotriesterase-related protein
VRPGEHNHGAVRSPAMADLVCHAGLVTSQTVETVRGPVALDDLGRVFMHEHVFVLNEEIRQNWPAGWDEDEQVASAVAKLATLEQRGVASIADPTVVGLGRNIPRVQRVAARTGVNIIAATGIYTYNDVPLYFRYRAPDSGKDGNDPMTDLFVGDLTEGVADTGVKAAFLKCCIEEEGLTPGVERVMRAVARAHTITGAPIMVHTHPGSQSGLVALRVLTEEGAGLSRVLLAHCGDTGDVGHLAQLADTGCLLGMDRFGLDVILPFEQRVATVAALAARGYASSMVLAHDASCHIDWFPPELPPVLAPNWHFTHLLDDVLPALSDQGVTDEQITAMLTGNPRRFFTPL